jgi:NitT/TauT family transport system substrate-binding protein/putative hydroxymethylpyrimidine transport system substrate-binding protein
LTLILLALAAIASARPASLTRGAAASASPRPASVILDFTPNAIHGGIYLALARHYDREHGIDLQVRIPGQSTDAVSLLTAGRVDFAILDIHDLAIADEEGAHLVGIMALEERPLASVIAQPRFTSPKQLTGQTVGVTGDPSDLAVLHSIVAGAGGKPAGVRTITIGYDAVPDLLAGRVAAATAFWNDEGVQLSNRHPAFHVFRVEAYGAPSYPELVLSTTSTLLEHDPSLARAVVRTLVEGYTALLRDPRAGERALESQVTGLSATAVSQQLTAELPAFLPPGGGGYGALEPSVLRAWASWEVRFGIVRHTPDIATMFDAKLR